MNKHGLTDYYRPRWLPVLFIHCLAGFAVMEREELFGLGWGEWGRAAMGAALWAVLLGGAAAALTRLFSGPAEEDAKVQERIAWVAIGMILLGLPLGLLVSWGYWDAYRAGIVLVALYAAPPVRLNRFPVAAKLIEAAGLGALTFYAGMALLGRVAPTTDASIPVYLLAFIALYLAARIAASDEQARSTPWLYWSAVGLGFAALAVAVVLTGTAWGAALLLVPLCVWCIAGLDRFDKDYRDRSGRSATLAGAWLLTDVAAACAAILG